MALIDAFEAQGNTLFKYRGQLPVVLFLLAIPFILSTSYGSFHESAICWASVISVAISVAGFIFRAYAIGTTPRGTSGRNTKEQIAETLNTSGIYSIVRHPLYVGNYFMWLGIVCFTMNISFIIIFSLLYWIYYERIMYAEERFLERKFGEPYKTWSFQVPAFIPDFSVFRKSDIEFSLKTVLKREYSGVLATVAGFIYVAVLRDYVLYDDFILNPKYLYILGFTIALTVTLRTLKYSGALNETDRS